jgi:hypothetical protein
MSLTSFNMPPSSTRYLYLPSGLFFTFHKRYLLALRYPYQLSADDDIEDTKYPHDKQRQPEVDGVQ